LEAFGATEIKGNDQTEPINVLRARLRDIESTLRGESNVHRDYIEQQP